MDHASPRNRSQVEAKVFAAIHTARRLTPYRSVLHFWWAWALVLLVLLVAAVLLLRWDSAGTNNRR